MDSITLIGGGGGAAAIVPYVERSSACHMHLRNADVVLLLACACSGARNCGKTVTQPKPDDLIKIREEAFNAVAAMGADPQYRVTLK